MKTLSQKTSLFFVLFSGLLMTGGVETLTEHRAYADSARESVSRTQIEEHFNRPTRRTLKKIQEAKELRLQRYQSQGSAIQRSSSVLYTSPLICAAEDVYNNPFVYTITKERLVERIAQHMNIDETSVIRMLRFPQSCAGPRTTILVTPPAQKIRLERTSPSGRKTTTIITKMEDARPVSVTAMQEKEPSSIDKEESTTETDLFPPEAKIRVLCRVQQRGKENRSYFEANIQGIAQQFAEKWNMNSFAIAEALIHPDLCGEEGSPFLLALLKSDENIMKEEPEVQPVQEVQEEEGLLGNLSKSMQKILSLPKAILVVGTLALITFIVLIGLVLAPVATKKK